MRAMETTTNHLAEVGEGNGNLTQYARWRDTWL